MPGLMAELELSTDGASFNASLGGEIGKLVDIARLAVELKDNPNGVSQFIASLAALAAPALPDGADVQAGLGDARAALPQVTLNAAPAALDDLAQFATLVTGTLVPLLARTLKAAQAIEGVAKAQFVCPDPVPDPLIPPGSEPPPPTGETRAAIALQRATDISARLELLPSPLTPATFLDFLHTLTQTPFRAQFFPISIPIADDILLPFQTLARWSQATEADIGAELAATLTTLRDRLAGASLGTIDAQISGAVGLETALRAPEVATVTANYIAVATTMAEALEGDDMTAALTAVATLDGHIDAIETLRGQQAVDFTPLVVANSTDLRAMPLDVHDRLLHLAMQLEPLDVGIFFQAFDIPTTPDAAAQQEMRDHLAPVIDFFEDLTEKLDLSVIEGDVATVATDAQGIADDISGALAGLAQQTRVAFAEVEAQIQNLPLDTLATEIRAAITQTGDRIEAELTSAFAPLNGALTTAITTISDAIGTLDAQTVSDAITSAINQITSVLQDPAIVSAAEEIRSVLDQTAEAAGSLSFAPITDEVIALIEQMEAGLRALDDTELNDALIGMLDAAMAILPADLRPVTQPLIDDLGVKIEQGPIDLLEDIREKPQEVVDLIRGFDPGMIIAEQLGGPFNEAKAAIGSVQLGTLIATLDTAFAPEKVRLKELAAPSRALAPVADAFAALLEEFDQLSPDALLSPIETAIEEAIQDVIAAAPIDEVFGEIEAVFDTIQAVLDTINAIQEALSKSATALGAMQNPDAVIDSWRDGALAKIDTVPNGGALDTLLGEIATSIDATQRTALLMHYDAAVAALLTALDTVDAEATMAQMIALRQRILPLSANLPAGPDRTTIDAVMARFDPLNPAHAANVNAAASLHNALRDARDDLDTMTTEFEDALHGPDGLLTSLRGGAADASLLRAAVEVEITPALVPVRYFLAKLGAAAAPTQVVAEGFAELSTRLTGALGDILTGPASLQAITQAVQQVVDTIRTIDLAFLRAALEDVFQTVRGEIEAAGPGPLIVALDQEFSDIIDTLSLSRVIPEAEVAALDQQVADLLSVLDDFDPANIIGDSVQESYEQDVLPLVDALDITAIFDALIEVLRGLEVELEGEMERVNTAYGQLLSARSGGASASVSLSIG